MISSPARIVVTLALASVPLASIADGATAQAAPSTPAPWTEQSSGTTASMRGLSVVSDHVAWASGTGGTFLWTDDAGAHWHVGHVPGAASLDFRDVHAVSLDTAYVMAAGQDTARIYRTTDRGAHWTLQYEDLARGAFLDAIAFFDTRHALALGDPMGGRFLLLRTDDAGAHWTRVSDVLPAALPGEAAFAASGTALVACGRRDAWFATGGAPISRVFRTHDGGRTWQVSATPVAAGNAAAGIFSIACSDARHGVVVGGNYAKPDTSVVVAAVTSDGGASWRASPAAAVAGYFSGVALLDVRSATPALAVGTEGTALSRDGMRWTRADALSLNSVAVAPGRGAHRVWGVGARGRIVTIAPADAARLLLHPR